MLKIALGLITALMLASCAYYTPNYSKVATGAPGHPDVTYPGPRAY